MTVMHTMHFDRGKMTVMHTIYVFVMKTYAHTHTHTGTLPWLCKR